MTSIVDAAPAHAVWVESSLRKSQRDASYLFPLFARHLMPCRVRVALLASNHDEWLGWCASFDGAIAYLYVRYAVRREGIASELIADAALSGERVRAAHWTRAADFLRLRMGFCHESRRSLESRAETELLKRSPRGTQ